MPKANIKKVSTSFATTKAVAEAMQKKLDGSGIDVETAKRLKFQAMTAEAVQKEGTLPVHKAGFKIPYFDKSGKVTKFWRFRFLETVHSGILALTNAKALRYLQPPDTVNELYLPPLLDWEAVMGDTDEPIIITEGELKAACACALGIPTVGLGGVSMFQSKKREVALLPGFKLFKWKDRIVYIVYDSDAATNPDVRQAEIQLARALLGLGANPHIVRLPALDGAKCGLDDYLLSAGKGKLNDILEETKAFAKAEALYELNDEVIYVRNPGVIFEYKTLRSMRHTDFTAHAYATRTFTDFVRAPSGEVRPVVKETAKEWLKWPGRTEASRITFAPGQPVVTAKGELNVWPGWACEPKKGQIKPWQTLLGNVFVGAEPEALQWFERWLAYPIQHPGVKMFTAAVVWGVKQGTGKSLIGNTLKRIYGETSKVLQEKHLHGAFNSWASGTQFAIGEEITGGDKRGAADALKSLITQEEVMVNVKYVPEFVIPDTINYYFTSQHPDGFFLEDNDRRFFIHEAAGAPLPPTFYTKYIEWLNDGGASALFYHLLHLPLGDFSPWAKAYETNSKLDMIETGRSDLGSWVARLRSDPDSVLKFGGVALKHTLWTAADLLDLYDPGRLGRVTANGMARELRRAEIARCCEGRAVRTLGGQVRLWQIRPHNGKPLAPTELGALYDKERGAGKTTKY